MIDTKLHFKHPHFSWGLPTSEQKRMLLGYILEESPMSIYGDEGIYNRVERKILEYYDSKYCILTNTGTSSLNSGYFGLDVRPGDEVIVPTYTFLATVTPLLRLGAKIVFCDADPITGNICPSALKRLISPSTKVVAITHMWGIPCDMDNIMPLIQENNINLLEDCSHSHFTRYKGKLVGTFGKVACFSVGAKKTLTCGEGGFLITSDPEVYIRATLLGHFEKRSKKSIEKILNEGETHLELKYKHLTTGYGENYRMHPYAAVMLFALLEKFEILNLIEKRRQSLEYFINSMKNIENISLAGYEGDYFTGAMYGLKPKITKAEKKLGELIVQLQQRNLEIKLPDSKALHDLPIFFQFKQKHPFNGAYEYLSGRISVPTFSQGLPSDKELIDGYCRIMDYVINKIL